MNEKVLVVAPHPDDETIGCGGTLLKHKASGDSIYWLIVTNIQVDYGWPEERVKKRREEITEVQNLFQFEKVFKLGFPTTLLDREPMNNLVAEIARAIAEVKPSVVYLPYQKDVHTDHQVAFKAAMGACKSFRAPWIDRILVYETLSETEFAATTEASWFVPNVFVDISAFWEKKNAILSIYESELMQENMPRSYSSINSLARYRGSRINAAFAEAFMLLFQKL